MKTLNYLIIAILFIGFSSCSQDGKLIKNRKADAANAGAMLAESITENFRTLKNMERFYAYNNEYLMILTGDSLEEAKPVSSEKADEVIETFRHLKKVFISLELLNDKHFNKDNSEFKDNILAACELLNKVHKEENCKVKTDEIIATLDAQKFEANAVTYELTLLFSKVLDENIKAKGAELETLYKAYAEKVKNIPKGTFSPDKVERLVTEPVSGEELLIEVYKLQLRNSAFAKKQSVETHFETIQKGMEELVMLYAEQMKSKKDRKEMDKLTSSLLEKFSPEKQD